MFSIAVSASHEKPIHFPQKLMGIFQLISTGSGFILSLLITTHSKKRTTACYSFNGLHQISKSRYSKQWPNFYQCIFCYSSTTESLRHIHYCCMRTPKAAEYQAIRLQQTWKCAIPTKKSPTPITWLWN